MKRRPAQQGRQRAGHDAGPLTEGEAQALSSALGNLLQVQETLSLKQSAIAARLLHLSASGAIGSSSSPSLSPRSTPREPHPQPHPDTHTPLLRAAQPNTSTATSAYTYPNTATPPPPVPLALQGIAPSRTVLLPAGEARNGGPRVQFARQPPPLPQPQPHPTGVRRPAWDTSVLARPKGRTQEQVMEGISEAKHLRESMKTPWESRARRNLVRVPAACRSARACRAEAKEAVQAIDRLLQGHERLQTRGVPPAGGVAAPADPAEAAEGGGGGGGGIEEEAWVSQGGGTPGVAATPAPCVTPSSATPTPPGGPVPMALPVELPPSAPNSLSPSPEVPGVGGEEGLGGGSGPASPASSLLKGLASLAPATFSLLAAGPDEVAEGRKGVGGGEDRPVVVGEEEEEEGGEGGRQRGRPGGSHGNMQPDSSWGSESYSGSGSLQAKVAAFDPVNRVSRDSAFRFVAVQDIESASQSSLQSPQSSSSSSSTSSSS